MRGRDVLLLVALAATWGLSFVFIRIASPALGPFLLVELRVGIAAIVLGVLVLARGLRASDLPALRRAPGPFVTLAVLNAAIPFTLISAAELVLPASVAAIVNATVPLFTAMMAMVWLAERLSAYQGVGLLLGFGGVVLLVGGGTLPFTLWVMLGVTASLAGAVSYAVGAIYTKRTFPDRSPIALTLGQETVAALLILPVAVSTVPSAHFTEVALLSAVGLAVFSTAMAYLVYFDLLQRIGPTRSTSVTFLVPVFGLAWSRVLLGEPLGAPLLAGLACILLGVGLVTRIGAAEATGGAPPTAVESLRTS
ncbi:MAG: DMT family transporter [Thermoplasmata archaeon]|nr:DMT family transporter [Thermoplasmata archaeon]